MSTVPKLVADRDDPWADIDATAQSLKPLLEMVEADEERGQYNTLSGMMMWLLGNVPKTADVAEWEGWRLEVVDLDGKRIDKVLACRVGEEDSEAVDSAQ